jgi:hypothetical protein
MKLKNILKIVRILVDIVSQVIRKDPKPKKHQDKKKP